MEVSFVPPDLRRFDLLKSEAIVVAHHADDRPPVGALGLLDWRMGGAISRSILAGRITGARGELVLVPARPRLTFEKLLIFGLGVRAEFDVDTFDATVQRMLGALTKLRVRASVVALPGRTDASIAPAEAMERFLRVAANHVEHDDVMLVESVEAQKAMEPVLEAERRRARARGSVV